MDGAAVAVAAPAPATTLPVAPPAAPTEAPPGTSPMSASPAPDACMAERAAAHDSQHHKRGRSHSREGSRQRGSGSRERSCPSHSRSRSPARSGSKSPDGSGRQHKSQRQHSSSRDGEDELWNRSRGPAEADAAGQQMQQGGPFAAAAAAPEQAGAAAAAAAAAAATTTDPGQQSGSATAAAAGAVAPVAEEEELLQSHSSGGASSLVNLLSLRPTLHPSPSATAAAALLPRLAAGDRGGSVGPSPLGPAGLARLHTPSAMSLAASQGIDISEVSIVQPSPMAAEATVAALSALMAQPARQHNPSLPHPALTHPNHHHHKRSSSAAGEKNKQLLSFGDELEEEDAEGSGGGVSKGGMSAATAKRFKHERTLVMINPSLSGDLRGHPLSSLEDDDSSLPCSPAAPLDRRLGLVLWGSAQAKGMRPYMEDRHTIINSYEPRTSLGKAVQDGVFRAYASVFDGHNGASAAEHAADRLHHVLAAETALRTCTGEGPPASVLQEEERVGAALVHAFEAVDREIMTRCRVEGTKGGATGLVLLRLGNQLYAAHCGDTRAVMSRNGEALRLTEDHKPNLPRERKRVEGLGGRVDFARCWRVIVDPGGGRPASGLAVSRSFGDPDFKEPLHLVTATPDVIRERLQPGDDFVILASDGLWDVMSDSDACNVVRRHLQQSGAPRQITPPQLMPGADAFGGGSFASQMRRPPVLTTALAAAAAERLVQESLSRGTMDNVTAVVGLLQWD
ncbi:hypothetical protein D9Q98_001451 [Chlorella vulgaris]|uniref:PPM-type phosphatase domain-containing protein n=1 Tax=Chlorella vulgaris TaxID=3077 RepID=A0A9D4TZX3_CHLVU|nr:hypothetical protein D9Q98_001451 [Chlorella vulgaris]